MSIHCCQDCTRREVGCHATCEEYLESKKEHDKEREYTKSKVSALYTHRCSKNYKNFLSDKSHPSLYHELS